MDAVVPGTGLAHGDVTTSEVASFTAMLRTLGAETVGPPSAPSIVPWLRTRLTDPPADDQPPHRRPASEGARQAAVTTVDQLAIDSPAALCHAELSPPNVLRGRPRLWFIDPRGMNGKAAYDIAVLAVKASNELRTAQALAELIARDSGNAPDRAAAWVQVADSATLLGKGSA